MTAPIEFLKYCLNDSAPTASTLRDVDWEGLLTWADKQGIIGVVFIGIEKMGNRASISFNTKMQWIGKAQIIEQQNRLINHRCVELITEFEREGFRCCVLKGQGNAAMYPNPLRRMSGDIDVWTQGKSIKETIQFAHNNNPIGKACYHHVDYGMFKDVEVEVHYRSTFMNNLIGNSRLQRWITKHVDEQFEHIVALPNGGKMAVPTWEFNVVFQLSHIYRHVIQGGIGFRQIIDYFYLLKAERRDKKVRIIDTLRYLRLEEIAGAVMWVLKEVLGLSEEYLVAPVDERRGKFLYEEIMQGGNFGQYDKRVKQSNDSFQRNLNRLRQDMRLVRYFPSECLWEPVFRVYHLAWRLRYN